MRVKCQRTADDQSDADSPLLARIPARAKLTSRTKFFEIANPGYATRAEKPCSDPSRAVSSRAVAMSSDLSSATG